MQSVAKLIVLSLVLGAAPAAAAESTAKKAVAQDQTKYCIQLEAFTGSRISKTECRTREDWARLGVNVDEALGK